VELYEAWRPIASARGYVSDNAVMDLRELYAASEEYLGRCAAMGELAARDMQEAARL
jgi:hypothetical protein